MKLKFKEFFLKKENVYLALALSIGFVLVFLNPPFEGVPDEGAHYLRAAGLSHGNLTCQDGDKIRTAELNLADELKPAKINGGSSGKVGLGKIKKALFEKDNKDFSDFGGAACGSNPFGYLPQVLGVKLAGSMDLPVLWGFYFGRLFNMLLAVVITFFAIRMLPYGKIIFLLIALLPMTMQQYASLSYDPLHISMIFLFTAYVLNLSVSKKEISKKEMLLLAGSAILAANIKWGFFPIMLLLFLLPWKKFSTKKQYWIFILATISFSLALFFFAQLGSVKSEGALVGVYPSEQLMLVMKNPFEFLNTVFNTLYDDANFFFETFLFKPGWLKVSMSPLLYIFLFIGLIVLMRSEDEKVPLENKQRIILGVTFLLGLLFVFLSLYVFWSKVGGAKIQGVQGRYFLGIFPLLIFAFYKSGFDFRFNWIRRNVNISVVVFVAIVFISTFIALWNIYYDKTESAGKFIYEQYISKEEKNKAKIEVTNKFRQTFLVKNDDFWGVKLFVNKDIYTGKGTFYLKDAECKNILREKELTWNHEEFGSIEVKFGLIPGAEKKQLCLEGELLLEQALAFKVSEDIYGEGLLRIDGADTNQDLIFDLIYKK